jgi:signal recognition particle subunit SEC65
MIYPIIIEADLIRSYGKILPKIDGILKVCPRTYEEILRFTRCLRKKFAFH